MNKVGRTSLALLVLLSATGVAQAQEQAANTAQEGVIRTESGVDLTPGLVSALQHDDNVIRDTNSSVSSWVATIAPSLKASLADGVNLYTVSAAVKNARYFSSRADNYTDGYLEAEARLSPASAHQLKLKTTGSWLHEDRGTGVSEGRGQLQSEETQYQAQNAVAEYEYGSPGSTGKLRANTRYYQKKYDNFRDITQYRDFDLRQLGGGFVYQLQDAYKLVLEASSADINFKTTDLSGSRDNTDNNYRLGAEWEISALTTGLLKLGYQDKNFEFASRENFNGFAWEIIVQWQPLTYSGLDIATGRRAKDVDALNVNADYIIETSYSIGWNHQWSESTASKLAYEYQTDEYNRVIVAGNAGARQDKMQVLTAELSHQPLRWLTLKGFVNLEDRTSTLGVIEYDRTVWGLELKLTL